MRKLASIQKIVSIVPIVGADLIEKATVLGWELVIAKKDNFKVGDLCVYCEIDSILPEKPEFEFLRERKFRIKTIKLKGQVSQGIAFPLSILPKGNYKEDQDVTELIGVKKYDPQAEFERTEQLRLAGIDKNRMDKFLKRYAWYRRLIFKPTKTPFPSFIKKTDEDRIQLFPNCCEDWKGVKFVATEKLDGQSGTYFVIPNPKKGLFRKKWLFGVCSRNFQLLKPNNSSYWTIAKDLNLEKLMIGHSEQYNKGLIVQGEIIGSKVQGNKYGRSGYEFYVFNVFEYFKGERISFDQTTQIYFCERYKLNHVPVLAYDYFLPASIPEAVETARLTSVLTNIPREGLVIRNYKENISFKIVNPDFLLKYSE
jgi:hypothetical protein